MTESTGDSEFGTRLRRARESAGLSQAELADKSGLAPTAITHFEAGRRRPSFENVRRIAIALKVSSNFLLGTPEVKAFRNEELLSPDDRDSIQSLIDRMTRGGGSQ